MRVAALAALGVMALPASAQDGGQPLSAIDWLSRSLESSASSPSILAEPPVADDASAPGITVTPLDSGAGPIGVLPTEVTGLPADIWLNSNQDALAALIASQQVETLPALQELLVTLMLTEALPPSGTDGQDLFLARVDKLLDLGALEAAQSLLESGDLLDPGTFRRWFDVTLLRGTEDDACTMLRDHPTLAPTLMARVFCVARNGDWNAAALTLNTARALGDITPEEETLLTRFLDPEFVDFEEDILPATRPSPLVYRMSEAVGDLMPTSGLPAAFAYADLRDIVAWRAQIEAAERLARRSAISENVLLDVYTARAPAASGGVWDRARAIQSFDRAIESRDEAAISEALTPAWTAMETVGLEVPFARLYGEDLMKFDLSGQAAALAHRIALLSPGFETAARSFQPSTPEERIWQAVATGHFDGVEAIDAPSEAVIAGFERTDLPEPFLAMREEGRLGELVLEALGSFQRGRGGDHQAVTAAIAALQAAGLTDVARRAALQFLILDARA